MDVSVFVMPFGWKTIYSDILGMEIEIVVREFETNSAFAVVFSKF